MSDSLFTSELEGLRPKIRGYLGKLTRSADVAEDLTQETMYRCWKGRANCRIQDIKNWALRSAYNTYCDWRRKQSRRVRAVSDADSSPIADGQTAYDIAPDPTPSVETRLESEALVSEFWKEIDRISPAAGEALRLKLSKPSAVQGREKTRLHRSKALYQEVFRNLASDPGQNRTSGRGDEPDGA